MAMTYRKRQAQVLKWLSDTKEPWWITELAQNVGVEIHVAEYALANLVMAGCVKLTSEGWTATGTPMKPEENK